MYLKVIILVLTLLYMLFLKLQYKQIGTIGYDKARKNLAIFSTLLLILQSGLRHVGVGPDTYQYMLSFHEHTLWTWQQILHNFIDVYQAGEGKDAGYYHKECPNVRWNEEQQPFGYAGVRRLFEALAEVSYNERT